MGEGGGGLHRLKDRMRSGITNDSANRYDTYMTYHDVRLTNEDIYSLKNDWLTDNILSFWEEYLEREVLAGSKSSRIVLLRPSMSFLLYQTADPNTLKDTLPDLTRTSHIFLPVNDCRDVSEAEGGSHWSLLLVSVVDGLAFHYDSLLPGNRHEANSLTQKIGTLVGKPVRFLQLDDTPQQENGSDCGVFACLCMRYILVKRLLTTGSNQRTSLSLGTMEIDAQIGRKEILRIIDRFKRKSNGKTPYVLSLGLLINLLILCSAIAAFPITNVTPILHIYHDSVHYLSLMISTLLTPVCEAQDSNAPWRCVLSKLCHGPIPSIHSNSTNPFRPYYTRNLQLQWLPLPFNITHGLQPPSIPPWAQDAWAQVESGVMFGYVLIPRFLRRI